VVAGCGPNSPRREKWLEQQRALGFEFVASEGNVADWDSTKAAFDKVKAEVGEVDVLVNNAGITRDVVFRKMTRADWDAVIDTNLTSLFNVTKQVIDGMADRGWGRIINISSVNGQKGQFGQTNYSTAKAGMHGFTMALAQEVATKGVTVNTVSPGYIATDMVKSIRQDVLDKIVGTIPVKRLGDAGRNRLDLRVAGVGRVGFLHRCRLLAERRPAHGLTGARADVAVDAAHPAQCTSMTRPGSGWRFWRAMPRIRARSLPVCHLSTLFCCGFSLNLPSFHSALLSIESGQWRNRHHCGAFRLCPVRLFLRTASHAVQQYRAMAQQRMPDNGISDDTRIEHRWPRPKKAQSD
jgi:acetoacetyl-CoA reductase